MPIVFGVMILTGAILILCAPLFRALAQRKPNWWVGIRTGATLRDPEIWKRVHERSATPTAIFGMILIAVAAILWQSGIAVPDIPWVEGLAFIAVMSIWLIWIFAIERRTVRELKQERAREESVEG